MQLPKRAVSRAQDARRNRRRPLALPRKAAGLGQRKAQVNRTAKCLPRRERENFNQAVFALAFFSQRLDREPRVAISRGLLDCPCPV